MNDESTIAIDADRRPLVLVWGTPSLGPRSQVLARVLGIREIHFVYSKCRRGLATAPYRYSLQAVRTLRLLFHKRPQLVFVQSPPSLAVLFVWAYCALTGSRYIIDAHSAAFLSPVWTWPRWLARLLARNAVATIVTNDYFYRIVNEWGGRAFVLPDIPTTFPRAERYPLGDAFSVAVVNTFGKDEPLQEVLEAAAGLDGYDFYVTGKKASARPGMISGAPANVHFTDYLPTEQYYALLSASHAIICLTTRDNTMQRGACEALWLGKPIITSDWPLLRDYFKTGAIHVANTRSSIRQGVLRMKERHGEYQAGILELQAVRWRDWQERIQNLSDLIQVATGSKHKGVVRSMTRWFGQQRGSPRNSSGVPNTIRE